MTRILTCLALAVICASAQTQSMADLRSTFDHPPDDARIMMRWWWFGPAVEKAELERELRIMKEGGASAEERARFGLRLVLERRVPGRPAGGQTRREVGYVAHISEA